MKKIALLISATAFALLGAASCAPFEPDSFNGEFNTDDEARQLELNYSGAPLLGKTAVISSNNGKTAEIILKGLPSEEVILGERFEIPAVGAVPGETELVLNVKLKNKQGVYTFHGTEIRNSTEIAYDGKIENSKVTINLNVKLDSQLAAKKFNVAQVTMGEDGTEAVKIPAYYKWSAEKVLQIEIVPGFPPVEFPMESVLGMVLGSLTFTDADLTAVEIINNILKSLEFREDGNLVAVYSDKANIGNPKWEESPINVANYYTKGNQFFLLLNVEAIKAFEANTKAGENAPQLNLDPLFDGLRKYLRIFPAGIPMTMEETGSGLSLYLDTGLLKGILEEVLLPFLSAEGNLDAIIALLANDPALSSFAALAPAVATQVPGIVESTDTLRLGLNLEAAEIR